MKRDTKSRYKEIYLLGNVGNTNVAVCFISGSLQCRQLFSFLKCIPHFKVYNQQLLMCKIKRKKKNENYALRF